MSARICRMCSHMHTCEDVLCMGREGVPTSREEEITQQARERLSFISNRQTDMLQIPATAALNRPAKTPQENTLEETQTLTHSQRLCVSVCVRMFLCLSLLSSVNESVCVCASCVCFKLSFTLCVCVCLLNPALWISDVGGTHPLPLIRARAAASRSLLPALNFR